MATNKIVNSEESPTRRRRSPAAARDNILAAAEQILRERGPLDLKLTEVAQQAGVATATVLHHFASIGAVQAALMERMVTQLATRIIEVNEAAAHGWGPEADIALFDAFEEHGAARLAAWLVMTGEAVRLSVVRQAVDDVVTRTLARLPNPPDRSVVEDIALAGITMALGAGLFGQTLSELLGKPADSARSATLTALAARAVQAGVG